MSSYSIYNMSELNIISTKYDIFKYIFGDVVEGKVLKTSSRNEIRTKSARFPLICFLQVISVCSSAEPKSWKWIAKP